MRPGIARRLRAPLRAPLLHFLLVGGALAALRPDAPPEIVLGRAEIEALRGAFETREGRLPDANEQDALLDAAIDEEILVREGWAAGRLRHDGAVVSRLARLGRFLGPDPPEPAEAAVRRARELGLDRSDPVIRRYLAERARLALAEETPATAPDEEALRAHLERHAERFALPERLRLRHVFVSRRRGPALARAAAALEPALPEAPEGTPLALGDPFPLGDRFVASRAELARSFGPAFAAALDPGARGRWQGPVPSAHGLHWVWLDPPLPARRPELSEVRGQVRQDWIREHRERRLREALDALRGRYAVRIEGR